jgi:hypothetical protein
MIGKLPRGKMNASKKNIGDLAGFLNEAGRVLIRIPLQFTLVNWLIGKQISISCLKATGINEIKKINCSSLQRTDKKAYELIGFSLMKRGYNFKVLVEDENRWKLSGLTHRNYL